MTLQYPFPIIEHIDDVLPHIDDNFRVVEKEGLTFINYNHMGADVFPVVENDGSAESLRAAVRRECRGITFDTATGALVSRPFHKFFNAGEREDVALHLIDVSQEHQMLEKLDGSMVRPLPSATGWRWGTKMGVTDVGMLAEVLVAEAVGRGERGYLEAAKYCDRHGLTPLFEFCSRKARIVVDYPADALVLLAIRDNRSGVYLDRRIVRGLAGLWEIPVVDYVDVLARPTAPDGESIEWVDDLDEALPAIRAEDAGEGKIIVFADGHAVKIKADKYVRIHRAKDMMRSEMRLLDLFFNNELDDLMAAIDPEDRNRIIGYLASFHDEVNYLVDRIDLFYHNVRAEFETKKNFALSDRAREMPTPFKSLMFSLWDGKFPNGNHAAEHVIRSSMTSETKFAEMKMAMSLETGWDDVWAADTEDAA